MLCKRLKGVLKTYMYLREVEFITQNFDNVPAHTSFYNQISIFLAQLHITFILNQWNKKWFTLQEQEQLNFSYFNEFIYGLHTWTAVVSSCLPLNPKCELGNRSTSSFQLISSFSNSLVLFSRHIKVDRSTLFSVVFCK